MKSTSSISASFRPWLLLLALFLAGPEPFAQNSSPPEKMTYQGYLTDSTGAPLGNSLPQNYDIIFRVYDASSSGTRLWSERQTVTIDKGYFSVLIGTGTPVTGEANAAPTFSWIFLTATASDRFLDLAVVGQGSGGTSDLIIQPRMQLLPSPYAFLATKAQQLDASSTATHRLNDQSLYLRTTPDINNGFGYATSFGGASIDGPKLFGNLSGVLGTLSGGEKTVLKWESNGRVAINKTTAAATTLDVNGTVTATDFSGPGTSLTGIPAAAIGSGQFNTARIPNLNANKITAGTLDNARLGTTVVRTDLSQTFTGTPSFNGDLQLDNSNYGLLRLDGTTDYLPFTDVDGVVLHGYSGGVLGIRRSTGDEGVLRWGFDEVDIYNSIKFQVDDLLLDAANNEQSHRIFFKETAGEQYGFSIVYAGEANPTFKGTPMTLEENSFHIMRHQNDTNGIPALTIHRGSGRVGINAPTMNNNIAFMIIRASSDTQLPLTLNLQGRNGDSRIEFYESGLAAKPGGGNWAALSDRRLKHDIKNLSGALDKLLQLRSVTFEFNDPEKHGKGRQTGFVAQEVEEVFPNWVHEVADGMKSISVTGFESLTVQALRELKTEQDSKIKKLEEENASLRARLDNQEKRLSKLEDLQGLVESLAKVSAAQRQ